MRLLSFFGHAFNFRAFAQVAVLPEAEIFTHQYNFSSGALGFLFQIVSVHSDHER